jgi:hypothetical protein
MYRGVARLPPRKFHSVARADIHQAEQAAELPQRSFAQHFGHQQAAMDVQ